MREDICENKTYEDGKDRIFMQHSHSFSACGDARDRGTVSLARSYGEPN